MANGKWNHSGSRWQWLALISIVICVIVGVTVAFGRDAAAAQASPPQQPSAPITPQIPPTQAQAPAKPSVNAVAQAAVKMGVLSCVSRINQVATFLTDGTQSGVFIFNPNQESPDQHVFTASFEMVRPDSSAFYATASFFPNQDAVYDTVEYVNMTCEQVEKTVFKDLKRKGIVKKNIVVLDAGSVKVFLMPAGSGCVVIKKEVVQ